MTESQEDKSEAERWDATLTESNLRMRADMAWSVDSQLNKAAEEFSEFSAAINRALNEQQERDELLQELVDARLMLWQLELRFTDEELAEELETALEDLEHRLELFS
ncbi:hypothetical protein [Halorubrum sp. AJ67]|uniref:hypothetical protein n=1 Tax=Halorubrum sp. AJ67 TaxID=1173487 RepID=UPI0003DC02C6|nr:hypothetical protein [Halorubrum sp. AJ67]CDK38211.1 hypothetical protein BN903_411 [Halorubrum sp. AJ67]